MDQGERDGVVKPDGIAGQFREAAGQYSPEATGSGIEEQHGDEDTRRRLERDRHAGDDRQPLAETAGQHIGRVEQGEARHDGRWTDEAARRAATRPLDASSPMRGMFPSSPKRSGAGRRRTPKTFCDFPIAVSLRGTPARDASACCGDRRRTAPPDGSGRIGWTPSVGPRSDVATVFRGRSGPPVVLQSLHRSGDAGNRRQPLRCGTSSAPSRSNPSRRQEEKR